MNGIEIWNELSYLDGVLFSLWLGMMYWAKNWIDNRFK